ncbi:MAG: hypothetical protein QOD99_1390 [Chthoniobacter sp.]|jgi:hypothetical protein|nr:hypothetical protein [Chthoniobacter sp.]
MSFSPHRDLGPNDAMWITGAALMFAFTTVGQPLRPVYLAPPGSACR